jgi:hypothetical protein
MPQMSASVVFSSVVELALPGTGVGAVHLGTLLLGELYGVVGRLGRVQPQQAGRDALGVSGGDRRRRNQRDEGCRTEKKGGESILEEGHGDVSLSVDAPPKAHSHGMMMWLNGIKVTSQLNQIAHQGTYP